MSNLLQVKLLRTERAVVVATLVRPTGLLGVFSGVSGSARVVVVHFVTLFGVVVPSGAVAHQSDLFGVCHSYRTGFSPVLMKSLSTCQFTAV